MTKVTLCSWVIGAMFLVVVPTLRNKCLPGIANNLRFCVSGNQTTAKPKALHCPIDHKNPPSVVANVAQVYGLSFDQSLYLAPFPPNSRVSSSVVRVAGFPLPFPLSETNKAELNPGVASTATLSVHTPVFR
eukprot:2699465-Amphidinium_carterae.1